MNDKWEYDVFRLNSVSDSLTATLARFGEQGWEFVCALPQPPITNLIFKRRMVT